MFLKKLLYVAVFTAALFASIASPAWAECGLIVIDPGHGGWDSGAVGPTGFFEKTANLDIALRLRDLLRNNGYQVALTRDTDKSPNTPARDLTGDGRINISDDLQARVDIANNSSGKVFISLHNNASISRAGRGTETYYWSGNDPSSKSARLARLIQEELVKKIGLYNRGVKAANFYVLRRTNMPAALVEGAFITNPTEELLLKTPSFRQNIAIGVFRGIRRFVGPGAGSEPTILRRSLKPKARLDINLSNYFCEKSIGARVTADVPIVADRSMYFDYGAVTGGSSTRGAPKASKAWYLAEGYTGPGFDTWILLVNPTGYAATARIKYMTEQGSTDSARINIKPFSRKTVHVNKVLPNKSFGARVIASRPIVVERSVFFNSGGRNGGHSSIGAMAPSRSWYFAEGYTGDRFDTWLLLANPRKTPAKAKISYFTPTGPVDGGTIDIPAYRRRSVSVDAVLPASEVSMRIDSDNGIVAERSVYFNHAGKSGATASIGARRPSRRWYFAEGDTRAGSSTFLTLQNPADSPATVKIHYMLAKGIEVVRPDKTIPPKSRLTVTVAKQSEIGLKKRVAVKLTSDIPIVAERPMYLDDAWRAGGHNSIGSMWMSKRWYFAEGFTGSGFDNWLLISNPTRYPAKVKIRVFK